MQEWSPLLVFFKIFSDMFRQKNVAGVATIHHSSGRVDAGPSHVGAFVHVHYTTDRSTVNAHPNVQTRIVLERAAALHCTLRGFLRTPANYRLRAVPGEVL